MLPQNRPAPPDLSKFPVGTKVRVLTGNNEMGRMPAREVVGTVKRHISGWLAEVELPGGDLATYAPEGMEVAK